MQIEFEVGDPIYVSNHSRISKLGNLWNPYKMIIKPTGPLSFEVRN